MTSSRQSLRSAKRAIGATPLPGGLDLADTVRVTKGRAVSALTALRHRHRPVDGVVLVSGSARSGTTWLAELINHQRQLRYVFEPFDPYHRVDEFASFGTPQYLRPGAIPAEQLVALRQLFGGRISSWYTDQWNPRPWRRYDRLLVKCVSANLMSGAITHEFANTATIHIVRHPLAVVSSRRRLAWAERPAGFLHQPDFGADFPEAVDLLNRYRAGLERQVAIWCVEQRVQLDQLPADRSVTVFYEDLLLAPTAVLGTIGQLLGDWWSPPSSLDTPSATAWNGADFSVDPIGHAYRWSAEVSQADIDVAAGVVDAFGLGDLYPADFRRPQVATASPPKLT